MRIGNGLMKVTSEMKNLIHNLETVEVIQESTGAESWITRLVSH